MTVFCVHVYFCVECVVISRVHVCFLLLMTFLWISKQHNCYGNVMCFCHLGRNASHIRVRVISSSLPHFAVCWLELGDSTESKFDSAEFQFDSLLLHHSGLRSILWTVVCIVKCTCKIINSYFVWISCKCTVTYGKCESKKKTFH